MTIEASPAKGPDAKSQMQAGEVQSDRVATIQMSGN